MLATLLLLADALPAPDVLLHLVRRALEQRDWLLLALTTLGAALFVYSSVAGVRRWAGKRFPVLRTRKAGIILSALMGGVAAALLAIAAGQPTPAALYVGLNAALAASGWKSWRKAKKKPTTEAAPTQEQAHP